MDHTPGFLKLVDEARPLVKEITLEQARERLRANPGALLLDVREDHEWQAGHAAEAAHLGKGILERDLERLYPEKNREILMYCGGGYRSILTAAAAGKMGYTNVYSVAGGFKALAASGWPLKTG